jgi:hypothetical protein
VSAPVKTGRVRSVLRVGSRGFIGLYALSYPGGSLLFLAPLLASLALKVNDSPLGDAQAVDARGPGCGAV